MKGSALQGAVLGGVLLVIYTIAVTASDAFTKHLSIHFEAPQILTIVSATILTIIVLSASVQGKKLALQTQCPGWMALRAGATVLAGILFFYAFALLPFAEVFLFIACVPIFVGLLSAPILGEHITPRTWLALIVGSAGVFLLFPGGFSDMSLGHFVAFGASFFGTVAIVMARRIARVEDNPLALVFYPQLAILVTMAAAAPYFWVPIGGYELLLAIGCGATLFVARYALARAIRLLPAYAASTLMNLQFVWMVMVGVFVFNEVPGNNTILGALVIVLSGMFLIYDQHQSTTSGSVRGAGA